MKSIPFLILYTLSPLMLYGAVEKKEQDEGVFHIVYESGGLQQLHLAPNVSSSFSGVYQTDFAAPPIAQIDIKKHGSLRDLDVPSDNFEDTPVPNNSFYKAILENNPSNILTIADLKEQLKQEKEKNGKLTIALLQEQTGVIYYQKRFCFCAILCPFMTFMLSWVGAVLFFERPHC